jgi:hypothetical protein
MNAHTPNIEAAEPEGLALLRRPFPDHQVSKLPKETKAQAEQRKADQAKGNWPAKCAICEGFHHPKAVHLDYVGHAALTDRLLDTDPDWSWEPVAFNDHGLPAFDPSGGLWIRLTVCGVTRLGYGHAAAKPQMDPGSREKEVIGDALRNAAMRFGAALDLWHKGDLHLSEDASEATEQAAPAPEAPKLTLAERADVLVSALNHAATPAALKAAWAKGAFLCAELDTADPEKLAAIEALHLARQDELETPFTPQQKAA